MYLGSQQLTIDPKGRLPIGYTFRRHFNEERDGHTMFIVPGRRPRTLALYQQKIYERMRAAEPDNESLSEEAYEFRMFESGHTVQVDPDEQGRVQLGQRLLDSVGLGKDVTLVGMGDHLVLWQQDDYEAFSKEMWSKLPEKRAAVREEMRAIAAAKEAAAQVRTATAVE